MTQSPPPQPPEETARELLAVTQADRDAAADHVEGDGSHSGYMLGTMIREGRHDDYPLVQAFGRDRFTRAIEQCAEIVREAARTWQWEAEEDDGYAYRLKACAERRAQSPGTDDDCPQDGSCGECATEMHEHFETPASKERRRELRCLADAISALDPTTRATLTHPISREAVADKAREEVEIKPHIGTDCDPDAHQWVRGKWGADPNRYIFTAWHMADAYQAGKAAALAIQFEDLVKQEGRILAAEMRVEKLKRLVREPDPFDRGSYEGDTFYPVGGTQASHVWKGGKWEWLPEFAQDNDNE
jgi:hypothetical protein